jgi:hypothetical protein
MVKVNDPVIEPIMPRAPWLPCAALLLLLGGCTSPAAFICEDDMACAGVGPEARCEANGYCSFEDPTCEHGGRRYGELVGDGLGRACVDPQVATDDGTGTGQTSGPTTLDGGSTSLDDGPGSEDTGGPDDAPWWDCGWAARRELVLERPSGGEVLHDVPVLVVLDASRIDPSIMAPDGHDLRVVADDGITVLPYDIEQWSPTGLSWAWVRVPELPGGQTRLHMYYGNPGAPSLAATEVWSDYAGVWHMGFELADATGLNVADEVVAESVPGQAATAQRFASGNDGVSVVPTEQLDDLFARGGTITAMIRPAGWGGGGLGAVVGRADNAMGDGGWVLQLDGDHAALRFARGFDVNRRIWLSPDDSIALHAWSHVAVVYLDDPDADPVLYIDGVPQRLTTQGSPMGGPVVANAPLLHIGGVPQVFGLWFHGLIDELRVAALPRSDAWIAVQAASLRDDLVRYGPPRSAPCRDPG